MKEFHMSKNNLEASVDPTEIHPTFCEHFLKSFSKEELVLMVEGAQSCSVSDEDSIDFMLLILAEGFVEIEPDFSTGGAKCYFGRSGFGSEEEEVKNEFRPQGWTAVTDDVREYLKKELRREERLDHFHVVELD